MGRLGVWCSAWGGAAAVCSIFSGCDTGPNAVPVPTINPAAAAAEAMAMYDANKDGALDAEELKKVPGLTHHPAKFDPNSDGKVDQQEIATRLGDIYKAQVGMMNYPLIVKWNGQPLAGATVKMIPEKFLGSAIKPAEGITDANGYASPTLADADVPSDLRGKVRAMHNGIYKVEITHPSIKLPEIYNTATTLGLEVTNDTSLEPPKLELKAGK